MKSWRDTGDTPCRQNHQEDAKLWPLHTSSWCRASPIHINGETTRVPGPPVTRTQMTWEDADKVSLAVCGTPTDKPGPDQNSPVDRPTSTPGKKRNWVISNKNNKDTWERGLGTLSTKDWGKGILPETVNKQARQAGEAPVGAGCTPSNQEWESLWEWRMEENSTREKGRPTSHGSCKQTLWQAGAVALPSNQERESL
jgi:hypothetical protein